MSLSNDEMHLLGDQLYSRPKILPLRVCLPKSSEISNYIFRLQFQIVLAKCEIDFIWHLLTFLFDAKEKVKNFDRGCQSFRFSCPRIQAMRLCGTQCDALRKGWRSDPGGKCSHFWLLLLLEDKGYPHKELGKINLKSNFYGDIDFTQL